MKAICPNCGSEEIVGADHVLASAYIADWEMDDGAMRPIWVGESEVHWDTQEPVDNKKPYSCVDCDTYYAADELKFEPSEELCKCGAILPYDDCDLCPDCVDEVVLGGRAVHLNTGSTALTDQQREDAEDLS